MAESRWRWSCRRLRLGSAVAVQQIFSTTSLYVVCYGLVHNGFVLAIIECSQKFCGLNQVCNNLITLSHYLSEYPVS